MQSIRTYGACLLWVLILVLPVTTWAQAPDKRFYIAPMVSFGQFDDTSFKNFNAPDSEIDLDDQTGYTVAIGKPLVNVLGMAVNFELYAFGFSGVEDQANDGAEVDSQGYGVSALLFPVPDFFPFFLLAGVGAGEYEFDGTVDGQELEKGDSNFYDLGVGVLIPIPYIDFGYGVKLRAEYRYRDAEAEIGGTPNLNFHNYIASVGLSIPLGPPPAEPKPEPAPPPPPPAPEPQDSDGDGVIDADDQCPGTPPGTAVNAQGCPAQKQEPIVLKGVTFEFNSARLTAEAEDRLDNVVNALKASSEIEVRVEGHTDSIGSASYNLDLSQQRAEAVKRYLVEHGIDPGRLTTVGYGETQPVAPNNEPDGSDNPEGRAKNRRVELEVTSQ